MYFLCSFVCFVDAKRIWIYGEGSMKTENSLTQRRGGKTWIFTTEGTEGTEENRSQRMNADTPRSFTDSCICHGAG